MKTHALPGLSRTLCAFVPGIQMICDKSESITGISKHIPENEFTFLEQNIFF